MLTSSSIKLAVIGSKGAGKTAMVVRYLTRRFIGEYSSESDCTYKKKPVKVSNMKKKFKILDTSGDFMQKNENEVQHIINWADGFIIVYDICSRDSFKRAILLAEFLRSQRSFMVPITLVGNKLDHEPGRQVTYTEAKAKAETHSIKFHEISTSDDVEGVRIAFENICADITRYVYGNQSIHLCEIAKLSHQMVLSPIHFIDCLINNKASLTSSLHPLRKIESTMNMDTKGTTTGRIVFPKRVSVQTL